MEANNKVKKTSEKLTVLKSLEKYSKQNLTDLIAELYAFSKSNANFLNARFIRSDVIIEKYKQLIKEAVCPEEPWKRTQRVSLREGKQAISDYKKAARDGIGTIDLMIFYVECGADFEYGSEQYYTSVENMFEDALILMKKFKHEEIAKFVERSRIIVEKACDGYGHKDQLRSLFEMSYPPKKNNILF